MVQLELQLPPSSLIGRPHMFAIICVFKKGWLKGRKKIVFLFGLFLGISYK